MHLFIDESGVFSNPRGQDEAISAVGALCVPSRRLDQLLSKFTKLKEKWGAGEAEVKGSELQEHQIREALVLLRKHDARAKLAIIDMGLHEKTEIEAHCNRQADRLTATLTPQHQPSLRREIEALQERVRKLPPNLYAQMVVLVEVVADALQNFTLWHAARDGRELSAFHWAADPKEQKLTEYEELWQLLVLPFIQSRSFEQPLAMMDGGDYSHFERYMKVLPERPDWLPPGKVPPSSPFKYPDPKLILKEDFQYPQSKDNLGLQLADIVVTTLRRALKGTLQAPGWQPLSGLLICEKAGTIKAIGLHTGRGKESVSRTYAGVIHWLHENASSMLPPSLKA